MMMKLLLSVQKILLAVNYIMVLMEQHIEMGEKKVQEEIYAIVLTRYIVQK